MKGLEKLLSGIQGAGIECDTAMLAEMDKTVKRQRQLHERAAQFHVHVLQNALLTVPPEQLAQAGIKHRSPEEMTRALALAKENPERPADPRDCSVMIGDETIILVNIGYTKPGRVGGHPNYTVSPISNTADVMDAVHGVLSEALARNENRQAMRLQRKEGNSLT